MDEGVIAAYLRRLGSLARRWSMRPRCASCTGPTICSRLTGDGRIFISGRTLIRTSGAARAEQQLSDDAALLTAYGDHFGIIPDRVPAGRGASR
jgi:N-hydroxyarylamine O-acetyltransferase